ncbi:hypothetical protein ACH4SP_25910 [Streptomyces sp. NPDC021093]|uniref:hypothetical protein n=1 Tax=Streptomyces sp. NPDC021093 TaxID=3365112 RepID=UPI0037B3FF40
MRGRLADPVGTVLTWMWAVGSVSGVVGLGVLVGDELSRTGTDLAGPALTAPDTAPDETAGDTA